MWNVIAAFVLDKVLGYQTGNKMRDKMIATVSCRIVYPLGGSRTSSLDRTASALDAIDYIDIEIDGTNAGGFTWKLRVEVRTADGSTSITPKLRNLTDATDAGVGAASTGTAADYSGSNQKQSVDVTIASGVKKYRLMGTPGDTNNDTFMIGYLERYATS